MTARPVLRLISLLLKLIALPLLVSTSCMPAMLRFSTFGSSEVNTVVEMLTNISYVLQPLVEGFTWMLFAFGGGLLIDLVLDMDTRSQTVYEAVRRRSQPRE